MLKILWESSQTIQFIHCVRQDPPMAARAERNAGGASNESENNYFTETGSASEAGSYIRLIDSSLKP